MLLYMHYGGFYVKIGGATKVTGLFGYPVGHSLSPAMHNAAFEYLNLDYCYVTFPVHPTLLGDAVRSIKALDLKGVNVTVPHKEEVIPFLDSVDKEASFIGAVNTIRNSGGKLIGYNTDGRGFMESLSEAGMDIRGKTVLVIGAGGASRAICYYLSEKASHLRIFDIDENKAGKLVADFGTIRTNVGRMPGIDNLKDIDVLINATPLGLKDGDTTPVSISGLNQRMIVCDLIYRKTPLLEAASKIGCKTLDGLGMLLYQGVIAFEIWTGIKPPVDIMRNAIAGFKR